MFEKRQNRILKVAVKIQQISEKSKKLKTQ